MYTGTMIEDLIQTVAYAEELAEARAQMQMSLQAAPAPLPFQLAHDHDYFYSGQMAGVA